MGCTVFHKMIIAGYRMNDALNPVNQVAIPRTIGRVAHAKREGVLAVARRLTMPPSPVLARRLRDAVVRVVCGTGAPSDRAVIAQTLEQGATPNSNGPDGRTLLTLAAAHGEPILLDQLLAHGADFTGRNPDGGTALHGAAQRVGPHTACIMRMLIERGANPLAQTESGATALHLLMDGQDVGQVDLAHLDETLDVLLGVPGALEARDADGRTAAHVWARRPCLATQRCLERWAQCGGDPWAEDLAGRRVAEEARSHSQDHNTPPTWAIMATKLHADGHARRHRTEPFRPAPPSSGRVLLDALGTARTGARTR